MIPPNENNYNHDEFEDWLIELLNEIDAEETYYPATDEGDEFNAYLYLHKKGFLNDLHGD